MLKKEEIALAEVLKETGYTTGHFGKWHLGALSNTVTDGRRGGEGTQFYATPWDNGYDECFVTEIGVPTWNPMENQGIKTKYWTGPGKIETENLKGDDSRVIMDRVIPFIQKANKSQKPFFTVIWFHTPHAPVVAGPRYMEMYKEFDENKQHYFGCITAMDEQITRLRDEIEKLKIENNTLIFFCSDNGPEGTGDETETRHQGVTGGFKGRKRSLYEGGVRVPGIVVWPSKIDKGARIDYPAVTSDYFPTIMDVLGMDLPRERPYDGISLVPAISEKETLRNGFIGFQSPKQKSIVTQRYKLIYPDRDTENHELYDLLSDKYEKNNIAGQHPEIVDDLSQKLEAWIASCRKSDAGQDYVQH
jgi:arylsulfatase A-like enzyme